MGPADGAYAALLTFADGAFASLAYSGYGRFDSDEFDNWIGEMGQAKRPYAGAARPRFASVAEEAATKAARNYGGAAYRPPPAASAHQHFGTIIVSCARADLRPQPAGVMIYQDGTARLEPLPPPAVPRAEVIDELYRAVVNGEPPLHDGPWAAATVEVLLAMVCSAHEGREIALTRQVAAP